ncbi:hypothetical protein ATANTOWER_003568 [Ataeniobius toweri]|uniref:Uncharacterized protein n=1 Tax=Ataeniobius toweri TaxID=208326 RepID=A0ABU7AP66_9TELE|nr:hypothetical protein [Ataeniobius toweri]
MVPLPSFRTPALPSYVSSLYVDQKQKIGAQTAPPASHGRAACRALTVTEPNTLGVRSELRIIGRRSVSSEVLCVDWMGSGDEEQNANTEPGGGKTVGFGVLLLEEKLFLSTGYTLRTFIARGSAVRAACYEHLNSELAKLREIY